MKNFTPGWRSTAFWITNLAMLGSFLLLAAKLLPPNVAAICAAVAGCAFILSRGIKKIADVEVAHGWKTSEFAVTVLGVACAVLASIAGILPPTEAAYVAIALKAMFAISQGLAQFGTQPNPPLTALAPLSSEGSLGNSSPSLDPLDDLGCFHTSPAPIGGTG